MEIRTESKGNAAHAIPETMQPHECCRLRRIHQSAPHITKTNVGGMWPSNETTLISFRSTEPAVQIIFGIINPRMST